MMIIDLCKPWKDLKKVRNEMNKKILNFPINNQILRQKTNCEWMLVLVIDDKETELLGCFSSWEYANIAEKAYKKHFGIETHLNDGHLTHEDKGEG